MAKKKSKKKKTTQVVKLVPKDDKNLPPSSCIYYTYKNFKPSNQNAKVPLELMKYDSDNHIHRLFIEKKLK